jgi:hypothetical protein
MNTSTSFEAPGCTAARLSPADGIIHHSPGILSILLTILVCPNAISCTLDSIKLRSTMAGIYNALHFFEGMPATFVRAFLAVAKDEGQCVVHYARVCGCSSGAMSKRLNDLGDVNSRDRSKPGYGLLEAASNPMDRRFTIVRLSPSGRRLAERIASMMGGGAY